MNFYNLNEIRKINLGDAAHYRSLLLQRMAGQDVSS